MQPTNHNPDLQHFVSPAEGGASLPPHIPAVPQSVPQTNPEVQSDTNADGSLNTDVIRAKLAQIYNEIGQADQTDDGMHDLPSPR